MEILIIDDEPRNIFALKAVLQSRGYRVQSAASAPEGIERLRQGGGIGVVLLDMMMPDMDGTEALATIRADERLRGLPVIAVTAKAMTGDREKALEAGADDYISKPVDVDKLVELLKRYE
ncbi:response regulator [Flaviaesturariibacter flavus]|uniref:Response regulator n=1 Tax=Flaviaesturariibacter flavus TaxID=2502780 RepID=A0A4R1B3J6_9BACT|nr:response regulator [Flaviaesturariibacter flavus]TCJ12672.1 response regulator [Flaviaesturariibacter flavus]